MVYKKGFAVKIETEGNYEKIYKNGYDYVALENGSEYKLLLINDRDGDCMAKVEMEGKIIGRWLIPKHENILIDRPADVARKFTFFSETDRRATSAGVVVGGRNNGLIKVTFYPKIPMYFPLMSMEEPMYSTIRSPSSKRSVSPMSPRSSMAKTSRYQSGSTVLGERSNQRFGVVPGFSDDDIDWDSVTEITIRLIAIKEENYVSIGSSYSRRPTNNNYIRRRTSPPRIDML